MNNPNVARAPVSEWLSKLPSVDKILLLDRAQEWLEEYGRDEVLRVTRSTLSLLRQALVEQKRDGTRT